MKKLALQILWLASAAACVGQGNSPLRVTNAFPLTNDCKQDDTIAVVSGSYDLAGVRELGSPAAARYVVSFSVNSDLTGSKIVSNGQTLDDGSRNEIFVTDILFDYSSTPSLSLPSVTVPQYFTLAPSSDGSYLITDLFTPEVVQALIGAVAPGGAAVILNVGMTVRGTVNGREPVESNKISFPITVYDSGAVCPAQSYAQVSGCFGSSISCVSSADAGI